MLLLARYFTIFAFTKISPGENKPIKIKKRQNCGRVNVRHRLLMKFDLLDCEDISPIRLTLIILNTLWKMPL